MIETQTTSSNNDNSNGHVPPHPPPPSQQQEQEQGSPTVEDASSNEISSLDSSSPTNTTASTTSAVAVASSNNNGSNGHTHDDDDDVLMSKKKKKKVELAAKKDTKKKVVQNNPTLAFLGRLLLLILIEFPLALTLGSLCVSYGMSYFYDNYFEPYMLSVKWTGERTDYEYTYYNRLCTIDDFSTHNINDMVASPEGNKDPTQIAIEHGSVVFPSVVSSEAAYELRDHILERNSVLSADDPEFIWLISNKHRWSYKIDIDDHPSVSRVLQEALNNPAISKTLEDLLGPDPSLTEMTAITAAYGAGYQHYHKDNNIDHTMLHMGRTFSDMYSLFIPLQDVTSEMGATDACPGFHICNDVDDLCPQNSMQMANSQQVWHQGDAWLWQMSVNHRGPKHVDPTPGNTRVMFLLSFGARPKSIKEDVRIPALYTSWSLKMEMSGLTLSDLQTREYCPMRPWSLCRFHKLATWMGLRRHYTWNWIHYAALRIINDQFGFETADLIQHLKRINDISGSDDGKRKKRFAKKEKERVTKPSSSSLVWKGWLWFRKQILGGSKNTMPKIPEGQRREYDIGERIEVLMEGAGTSKSAYDDEVTDAWLPGVIRKRQNDTYRIRMDDTGALYDVNIRNLCEYPKCSQFLDWKTYVERCIAIFKEMSLDAFLYCVLLFLVVLIVPTLLKCLVILLTGDDDDDAEEASDLLVELCMTRLFGSIKRVLMLCSPFVMIVLAFLLRIHTSPWGQDIVSGKINDRPFLEPDLVRRSHWYIPREVGPTIFPDEFDVLIMTRFDDPGFGQRNFHADISHVGNAVWLDAIKLFTSRNSSGGISWKKLTAGGTMDNNNNVHAMLQEQIITAIHNLIRSNFGTFMLQNPEGNWVYLTDNEGRKYTRRKLMEVSDPKFAMLGQTIRYMYGELRFGPNRKSALYRLHAPKVLQRLQEEIVYGEKNQNSMKSTSSSSSSSSAVTTKASRRGGNTSNFIFIGRMIHEAPKTIINDITASSRSSSIGQLHSIKDQTRRHRLEEGSNVVAYDGTMWLQGRILKVHDDDEGSSKVGGGYHYDVFYIDGTIIKDVHENRIRYVHPGMVMEGQVMQDDAVADGEPPIMIRVKNVKSTGGWDEDESWVM